MRLVPSGNRRRMVAQALDSGPEVGVDFGPGAEAPELPPPGEPTAEAVEPQEEQVDEQPVSEDTAPDVTEYIFKKLVGFGFPERRLNDYEDEFVKEKIHRDGSREITVTIPDRYYGSKKRLSTKDFSSMVNEMQKQFGLEFIDADRSDMKITMNFSTRSPEAENEDAIPAEDTLSMVYGPGKSESTKKPPAKRNRKRKAAYTTQELIKLAKDRFFETLNEREE